MKQVVIPIPPNPDDAAYKNNPMAYNRAAFHWMNETKGRIEDCSHYNDIPIDQVLTLGSYTLSSNISGTSTGTDVSNFLCSFIASMTRKGIVSPNTTGGNT